MKFLNSFILSTLIRAALAVAVTIPALQPRQSSPIRFFITSANQSLNGTHVTTNGTHLGIRPSSSSIVQATTTPGSRANTNILNTVFPNNGNVLALMGPVNNLAFVEVSNPPPPPPSGIIIEWDWWRLFPSPDPRVRMADMTASTWIAVPDGGGSVGDWLLTWFRGDIDPSMTTVTLFWELVPL